MMPALSLAQAGQGGGGGGGGRGGMGMGPRVYASLREAMTWYERAEAIRPAGNDDPLLRWNTCARLIMRDQRLTPPVADERGEPLFLE